MEQTVRHRAYLFNRPVGPWRAKQEEAMEDALASGAASRGAAPWDRKAYLGPGAAIVVEHFRNSVLYMRVVI